MDESNLSPAKLKRTWLRSIRPLLWWLLLVLVLFLYHTHERLSEKTLLKFSVTMGGKSVDYEVSVTLDGQSCASGQKVKIGKHDLTVLHPKAHAFSTNLFVWYGEHDLGEIALERIQGQLEVQVMPPARLISVVGPEFSVVLTNSAGITSSVPTDAYVVKAQWANHDETQHLNVLASGSASVRFAPVLGILSLQSEPSGASVVSDSGRTMGTTPLTLLELSAGAWKGGLRLEGYIPVPVSLVVGGNQTNAFRTNLVNWQYAQAMETARSSFAAGDLERTLQAVEAALKAQPSDPAALGLRRKSLIKKRLRNAEALMVGGNYDAAGVEARAVLEMAPNDANATDLLQEISARAEAQQQREKQEAFARRLKRITASKEAVEYAFRQHADAPLFEAHEIKAPMSAREAQAAIYHELSSAPAFRMKTENVPTEDSFAIFGALEIPGGLRRCVIVGSEIETNETHIVFKVMEFKLKTFVGFQGQITINRGYVTIDPTHPVELSEKERSQIKQGAALVEQRIRRALGENSPKVNSLP